MKNKFIEKAINEALKANLKGEIPVGCVIALNEKIIGVGHNLKESKQNVLKHAELIAIEKSSKKIKNWRLNGSILYTTLFPCPMCAGAIQQARIKKIIYIKDSNNEEMQRCSIEILNNKTSNHYVEIEQIEYDFKMLDDFFYKLRKK